MFYLTNKEQRKPKYNPCFHCYDSINQILDFLELRYLIWFNNTYMYLQNDGQQKGQVKRFGNGTGQEKGGFQAI